MEIARLPVLAVLGLAVYLGWSFLRGRRSRVPLYAISLTVAVCLFGAAIAQLLRLGGLVEGLNVASLALSLAALPSPPGLWERELRTDNERARLYRALAPRDLLSWQAWLKFVDRRGARAGALIYFMSFALGVACQLVVWSTTQPDLEGFVAIALVAPLLFGALSALWLYRGVKRVMPGT